MKGVRRLRDLLWTRPVSQRRRLQNRIRRYLATTVVLSLVLAFAAVVVSKHRSMTRTMEESAATFASLISLPVSKSVEVYRTTGQHMLRQQIQHWMRLNPDVVRLQVVDVEGRIAMDTDGNDLVTYAEGEASPRVSEPGLLEAVRSLVTSHRRVTDPSLGSVYRVVAPAVEDWGRHTFSLVATFSYKGVQRQLWGTVLALLVVLGVGLAVVYGVSGPVSQTITQGLKKLHDGVQRISQGHLDEQVDVRSGDEVQDLAEAFNSMAARLRGTIDELRRANRELESLDQAKADLLANVSHELKTPLTALRGYLELLGAGGLGPLDDRAGRAVEVCTKNVERLQRRIDELVQLSQMEKPGRKPVMGPVRLGELLHGVVETFLPRIEQAQLMSTLVAPADLPVITGSDEQIERLFFNLLDNAVKFTPAGGSIRLAAAPNVHHGRSGVLVTIADSGVGIPASEHVRVFDRFHQVDPSSRRRYGGMGLGLSLVRSIVEGHRGAVWVESEPDRGATFFVWLPDQYGGESSGQFPVAREERSDRLNLSRKEEGA